MPDMTDDELAAWNGLIAGDLEPLADLLESDSSKLHPILLRWLWKLLRGSTQDSDFRLIAGRHPDLDRASRGVRAKRKVRQTELETALIMYNFGALKPSEWEAAVLATKDKTGLSRSSIAAHWANQKSFIRMSVAHGILKAKSSET